MGGRGVCAMPRPTSALILLVLLTLGLSACQQEEVGNFPANTSMGGAGSNEDSDSSDY